MFVKKDYTQGPLTENVVLEFLQRVENGQIEAEGIGSGFMGKMKVLICIPKRKRRLRN